MDVGEPRVQAEAERGQVPRRSLTPKVQLAIVGIMVALFVAAVLFGPTLFRLVTEQPAKQETVTEAEPGTFRPSPQQWNSLKIAPIQEQTFRDAHQTDGTIAIDDDMTTPVFSPYSGRVTKLFAKAGDKIEQGAPLLAVAASEFVQAQNDLISNAATLRTARAQLNMAQTNEKRQHDLYSAQGGALKDWQQSQVDLANSQGTLASAQIALTAVRNRLRILGKSPSEIAALEAAPDTTTLDPEAIVEAPIGGTVIARQVGLGQNIVSPANGGSTPVFQIGDLSKVWLVANAREVDAPLMRLGDPVEVRVLAFPDRIFSAKITYVGASIDASTHRLPVRAEVENPDRLLKPQMFASFTIITGPDATGPAVPEEAIVYEGDIARVWVAHKDRSLELRVIRTGRSANGMTLALEGVRAGESVVTSGAVFIDRAARGD
ncbi:MAG: efflux RND transporter periplasmic adaptor subunit [Acetobacteraceae bacterium]|nr:efflux RND transporter periplasmic adaptor subunit [Acetobacteraceae bacterium]